MSEVILNGGLGNQLFQLALALHQSSENPARLNQNLGLPRTNKLGQPDIAELLAVLPVTITTQKKPSVILRKISTLAIRQSAKSRKFTFLLASLETLSTWCFSLFELRFQTVRINNGIGYDSRFEKKSESLNFGYFQTFKWASHPAVKSELMKLRPNSRSNAFSEFVMKSSNKKVLCIHVRLMDYRLENSFGIPSKKYYQNAIEFSKNVVNFDSIWLFSDEPTEALKFIPAEYLKFLEVVPEFPGGVVETFELMRHCDSYIIGNSTFSWWGAFLSHTQNPSVVAPSKWFKLSATPVDLIPKAWHKLDPYFVEYSE